MGERKKMTWPRGIALLFGAALVLIGGGLLISGDEEYIVKTDWLNKPAAAPVRFCSGKDLSATQLRTGSTAGMHQRAVDDYTSSFPGAKAIFVPNSTVANRQREYYLRLIKHGSKECDVIFLDVIYMAEFADKGLLYDMTPYLDADQRRADFDDQMMKTVTHDEKLWGVPKQLDAGVLFYRKDRARMPTSWQDVYGQAKPEGSAGLPGLRLQRETNEGLTVVFLELAYAASDGRPIISEDGTTANIDEPEVLDALMFMRRAVRDGVIPATEPGNEGSLDVYERGRASFLRGWPFVAARIQDDANRIGSARPIRRETARETRLVSLPPWRSGGRSIGVLGGHDLVIPRSAGNPSGALHFIDYLTSDEQVRKDERLAAQFPVLKSVAEDESSLTNKVLVNAIRQTDVIPRPSIPNYFEVSTIIAQGVQDALKGPADEASVHETLRRMDQQVQRVLG
jgi:ABC-type glycerol-3-phosphate transport system substrate-binding protein